MLHRYRPLLVVLLLAAASAHAQQGLTPYHVAQLRAVGDAITSEDGDLVAYTVSIPADPLEANEPARSELHVYRLADDTDRVVLTAEVDPGSIRWVPDAEQHQISYLARGEGDEATALYAVEAATGVVRRVVGFETAIGGYAWHEDGERVAFIAAEPRPEADDAVPYRPVVYEEGYTQRPVYVAEAYGDDAPRMLDVGGTAYGLAWHPGDLLAVAVAPTPLVDDRYMRQRIAFFDVRTGEEVGAVAHEGKLGPMAWSPDGERLAFIGSANVNDPQQGRLYVVGDEGGAPRDVLPDLEGHVIGIAWLDEETIGYVAAVGVETVYGAVEAGGGEDRVFIPPGSVVFESASANAGGDVVALVGHTPEHPAEVYLWTQDDREPRRLTNVNPWLEAIQLAPQEVITYEARDGLEIQGMLIRPLSGEAPAPLIVVVHGGPESHYANGWLTNYSTPGQMAAAEGYAVFYPNYRGSTGRGVAFSTLSQGDPAGAEFDDVIDGIDHLIEAGVADPARVGVTGGSYGGYATGWLSTRYSDRIAAGVMFVGISNKISKVGTTDIPQEEFFVHARKRPWDDWQFFLERSPIYYAGQSRTPLLILHGEDDPRVNPGQSFELYRHLRLRGQAPVRLVLYPGEGHGNRRATARYDYSLRMLRWFDHYLMGPGGDPPPIEVDYTFPDDFRVSNE
ncbi:MAG TPA: S9 family peptidase [Rubricoccaceae bacterium]|nr:S9 family peptidase [Rubricoccaceae bacterium]